MNRRHLLSAAVLVVLCEPLRGGRLAQVAARAANKQLVVREEFDADWSFDYAKISSACKKRRTTPATD